MQLFALTARLTNLRLAAAPQRLLPSATVAFKDLHTTAQLNAEPLKKKKRLDPAILRMREERKKRRIERGIRQLKRHAKKYKPIEESEVAPKLQKELGLRHRAPPVLEHETCQLREAMQRAWSIYCMRKHQNESAMLERIVATQEKALEMLKEASEELYNAAVQADNGLFPAQFKAVVSTPPIENYEPPDGKYVDTTKKWRP
ncbi:large ribosomal subunit protein mL40 [Dermacentor andersoni]|uniref:large ribosomal subunit protein mL40 n=1 Tax=Dermacentor andersoni TaxID=34620 RepID=UPI0021559C50|nr:39S ribosomal protein L40, mitochondrial-like [Dermacentor andersoni]